MHTCVYLHLSLSIYIYIHIYREREREIDKVRFCILIIIMCVSLTQVWERSGPLKRHWTNHIQSKHVNVRRMQLDIAMSELPRIASRVALALNIPLLRLQLKLKSDTLQACV